MNNVIKFPTSKKQVVISHCSTNESSLISKSEFNNENLSYLSTKEGDHYLFLLLKKWPCFFSMKAEVTFQEILESYYDNELDSSQNLALEYLFHMHDSSVSFDIAKALSIWKEEDRNFFILSLTIHSDLLDLIF